ncbi:MAG TPA: hypothetical protein VGU20_07730 [Stellaceae bacterium]|nr:hypothetical protein [Stellaceae bacterium]
MALFDHSKKAAETLLALAIVTGLGVSVRAQNASSPSCQTPMPKDVKIDAPAPGLRTDQARFLGIWNGIWQSGLCAVLAVQSIDQAGNVKLIYAYPEYRPSATSAAIPADALNASGHIENGALKFTSPRGNLLTFEADGDKLRSSFTVRSDTWHGSFVKQ